MSCGNCASLEAELDNCHIRIKKMKNLIYKFLRCPNALTTNGISKHCKKTLRIKDKKVKTKNSNFKKI